MNTKTLPPPTAWKSQPRADDGTWGNKPKPDTPTLTKKKKRTKLDPEFAKVLRSKGRFYIDLPPKKTTIMLKYDPETQQYSYDSPGKALAQLNAQEASYYDNFDFRIKRLNEGAINLHNHALAGRFLNAFTRHSDSPIMKINLVDTLPEDMNPAGLIAAWMIDSPGRTGADWERARHTLFGIGARATSKPLEDYMEPGWRWSSKDSEDIERSIEHIVEKLTHGRAELNPATHTLEPSDVPGTLENSQYKYLTDAMKACVGGRGDRLSTLPMTAEKAARWFHGVCGPWPYSPAGCDDASIDYLIKSLPTSEALEEFLEKVLDSENHGSVVNSSVLRSVAGHPHITPECAQRAWAIALRGDPPRVVQALAKCYNWETVGDPPRLSSDNVDRNYRHQVMADKSTLTEMYADWCAKQPRMEKPPILQQALEAKRQALQKIQDALDVQLAGGRLGYIKMA